MRSLFTILVLCFSVLAASAMAAQAKTLGPLFLGGPGKQAKPKTVGVGAKGAFERLVWKRWAAKRAYARGVYDIAGFAGDPGSGYRSRVQIRAYGRKKCSNGSYVYTKVLYRVRKPIDGRKTFRAGFATCRG